MMHEQMSKQKINEGGGNSSKKNNPRKNRGGINNNSDIGANVSVANALEPPEVEGGDALEANQAEPNAEMVSKDPTSTDNGGRAVVWFVLIQSAMNLTIIGGRYNLGTCGRKQRDNGCCARN